MASRHDLLPHPQGSHLVASSGSETASPLPISELAPRLSLLVSHKALLGKDRVACDSGSPSQKNLRCKNNRSGVRAGHVISAKTLLSWEDQGIDWEV